MIWSVKITQPFSYFVETLNVLEGPVVKVKEWERNLFEERAASRAPEGASELCFRNVFSNEINIYWSNIRFFLDQSITSAVLDI